MSNRHDATAYAASDAERGAILPALRKGARVTQTEVAGEADVPRSQVTHAERHGVGPAEFMALLGALDRAKRQLDLEYDAVARIYRDRMARALHASGRPNG